MSTPVMERVEQAARVIPRLITTIAPNQETRRQKWGRRFKKFGMIAAPAAMLGAVGFASKRSKTSGSASSH